MLQVLKVQPVEHVIIIKPIPFPIFNIGHFHPWIDLQSINEHLMYLCEAYQFNLLDLTHFIIKPKLTHTLGFEKNTYIGTLNEVLYLVKTDLFTKNSLFLLPETCDLLLKELEKKILRITKTKLNTL